MVGVDAEVPGDDEQQEGERQQRSTGEQAGLLQRGPQTDSSQQEAADESERGREDSITRREVEAFRAAIMMCMVSSCWVLRIVAAV